MILHNRRKIFVTLFLLVTPVLGLSTYQLSAAPGSQVPANPTTNPNEPELPDPAATPSPSGNQANAVSPMTIPTQVPPVIIQPLPLETAAASTAECLPGEGALIAPDPGGLRPALECVWDNGDGTYTALFGYSRAPVQGFPIAVSNPMYGNFFDSPLADRGQPTFFWGGRQVGVFTVDFDGSPLTWTLNGHTVTASSGSTLCTQPKPPTPVTPAPPPLVFPPACPTPPETPTTPPPTPVPNDCGATGILTFIQAPATTGAVLPGRSVPGNALGFPQEDNSLNFVSLGISALTPGITTDGQIILRFTPNSLHDGPGADFKVVETSPVTDPIGEKANVFVSIDGIIWFPLGTAGQGTTTFDLSPFGPSALWVLIQDNTVPGIVAPGVYEDGFDLDGVRAFYCAP